MESSPVLGKKQELEPAAEVIPSLHTWQVSDCTAPTSSENVPTGHKEHIDTPTLEEKVPAEHGTHPVEFMYEPVGQIVDAVCVFSSSEKVTVAPPWFGVLIFTPLKWLSIWRWT